MKHYSLLVIIFSLSTIFAYPAHAQSNRETEEWLALFNGKDLTGWDIKIAGSPLNENFKNTFIVKDGVLEVNYDEYERFNDEFGHLYYQKPYAYYKLRVEYRFTGEQLPGGASWNVRNSGVMVHSQSAASVELDQGFPVSIELQLLGGLGTKKRTTCNVCTPGTVVEMAGELNTQHCINSTSKTYHGDQWVTVEMLVLGDSVIQHVIDDEVVLSYEKPQIGGAFISKGMNGKDWEQFGITKREAWEAREGELLSAGYIALQAESHPIGFRKVELLNLEGCTDPAASNYKSYYVKSNNDSCKYD
ncbi:DUF1080 domain-containing protein [Fulvivirgaceae bacterium BMA12]|uniref:DUF1080 domain-containing protein n=1 Tax=Agaribacillus aureus TaxID=3051825 RepID=A0ABT8L015_9BACT|nr:DUF1080 domain-containing protein [Fulvivirgaceae bacterium BMA12]